MSKLGLGNIASMVKNAKKIQQMVSEAQSEFEKMEITGKSGADMVSVTMNGKYECLKVTIDQEAMTEGNEILEELITAAINDANSKIAEATQNKMSDAKGLMGMFEDEE